METQGNGAVLARNAVETQGTGSFTAPKNPVPSASPAGGGFVRACVRVCVCVCVSRGRQGRGSVGVPGAKTAAGERGAAGQGGSGLAGVFGVPSV